MKLHEQEIMNAICMHIAERKQLKPEQIEVELLWDEEHGFSAEVFAEGRNQYLVEANMLEAIERYLLNEHGFRVFRGQIGLDVEDEMVAVVHDA